MKQINEDIQKKEFKRIYLLCGEEVYLKLQYKNRLKEALISVDDTMNYSYFSGNNIDVGEIIEMSETLPFFANRRVILIENSGFLKTSTPRLAEYMEDVPETTTFIFVENEIDKRSKLYKNISKNGYISEFSRQDTSTLVKWISGKIKKENKNISQSTLNYFLSRLELVDDKGKALQSMALIESELEKLFSFTKEKEMITNADVDAICSVQINNHIFAMVDAVAGRKQEVALKYYYELLALKEPPMRILYLLSRQFRLLYEVKEMKGAGLPNAEIAKAAGLAPFIVTKYINTGRSYKKEQLRAILENAIELEEAVKTGRIGDVLSVELFIVKHSM
jgi:DNA polymerase-3 subunit delta